MGCYRLGYSPGGGDVLVRSLREEQVPEEVMSGGRAGAALASGRLFDRFRDRVMFPIFDVRGDAVGFGARLLGGEGPKYLNSPDSAIYQKSHLLYGLNWAKSAIVREGLAVVVEGYTDVIALAEAGRPLAVATCGTALGESHLDLLRRFTERVVLMFDADEAGVEASLRGFERSVPGDLDLRVALLPEGRDPADLASAGETAAIEEAIGPRCPCSSSASTRRWSATTWARPRRGAGRCGRLAALVARHPDRVTRHEYAVEVARRHRGRPGGGDGGGGAGGHARRCRRRRPRPPPAADRLAARRRRNRSCCA